MPTIDPILNSLVVSSIECGVQLTAFLGHSQILSCSYGEKLGCEIKSGSGLGTRLGFRQKHIVLWLYERVNNGVEVHCYVVQYEIGRFNPRIFFSCENTHTYTHTPTDAPSKKADFSGL